MNKMMINFDLDQKMLEIHYTEHHPTYAYSQIKNFLKKNGFEHNQGSGYISKEPMSTTKVDKIITRLQLKYPWVNDCLKVCSITIVDEQSLDGKIITARTAKKQQSLKKKALQRQENKSNKRGINR